MVLSWDIASQDDLGNLVCTRLKSNIVIDSRLVSFAPLFPFAAVPLLHN